MGNVNRRGTLSIALAGVLILGVVGGGFAAAATTASDATADATSDGLAVAQDDGEETETDDGQAADRIPITDAMRAAETELADRNATVVGAELGQRDGLLDFSGDERVYTVDTLLANGTHVEVAVNATNGSVANVAQQEDGFLEGVFGEEQVPQRPLDLGAMHNATEAVELARNETAENDSVENATVTSVTLSDGDDGLVYEVLMESGDGNETTVVVDATEDGQGVIAVEDERTGGDETDAGIANETGEGDGGNETDEGGHGG